MNKERMLELAAFIEKLPHDDALTLEDDALQSFDMSVFISAPTECRTAACIAGWAVSLWDPDGRGSPHIRARKILGLSYPQGDRLFYATEWGPDRLEDITPQEAAAEIRKMVDEQASNRA